MMSIRSLADFNGSSLGGAGDWQTPPPSPSRAHAPGQHDERGMGTSTWPPARTSSWPQARTFSWPRTASTPCMRVPLCVFALGIRGGVQPMIRPAIGGAALFTVLFSCAGCDGKPAAGQTSAPSTGTPTAPTSSPSATPDSRQVAAAGAIAGYRRYVQVLDAMTASGGRKTQDLPKVATGIELAASMNQAATYRGQQIHSIGSRVVVWVRPLVVGTPASGVITRITVAACHGTTHITAVDRTGKSIKRPGTPNRWIDRRELWLVDGVWKVQNGRKQGTKC